MLNIGITELFLFSAIALLVLGPQKIPEAIRFIAQWTAKLKRLVNNVQNDLERELRLNELRQQMQEELKKLQDMEEKMRVQMGELDEAIHASHSLSSQDSLNSRQDSLNPPVYYAYIQHLSPVYRIDAQILDKTPNTYFDIKLAV